MVSLSPSEFERILFRCASLPDVRSEVLRNHDDNRWWPCHVSDWRVRMLIAGLSTRISYAMISTYQSVVSTITAIGYPRLARLSDAELSAVVAPLGLQLTRVKFCRSLMAFIDDLRQHDVSVETASNDELINLIQREVHGGGTRSPSAASSTPKDITVASCRLTQAYVINSRFAWESGSQALRSGMSRCASSLKPWSRKSTVGPSRNTRATVT